ncbi:putative serine carboxypeptidase [Aulographum hederae CBS 113979]|uniref:Putative serine carboxypeptidase n=1 Tax=Aulographum hederae CBS 113979 TaxID=1176131 RepID=A0A6G1GVU8_9PEZI|nr:putative serine carboxypeptidase [Aulographum hederae CBS 113979]
MKIQTFLLAAVADFAAAQFVTPPLNLTTKKGYAGVNVRYKEVPTGICELNPNVKSYSGYADIAENEHVFFWFFEARKADPKTAPLGIWINGGPGSSSMIGLFQELGPCSIDADGNVVDNPYAWNEVTNMIFIDQPTQTGFSYSIPVPGYTDPNSGDIVTLPNNTCPDYATDWGCGTYSYPNVTLTANTTLNAAPRFWSTLQGFLGAFPQYAGNPVFFSTESYGGHYGPVFSNYILKQNAANITGATHIDLAGVLIGNGWFDPLVQYESYYNFTVWPGNTYDATPVNASVANYMYNAMYGPGNCYDMTLDCYARGIDSICSAADNFCYSEVEYIYDIYTGRDEYDVRELMPDPFPPEFYVDYLNSPDVLAAIGAYVNFTEGSPTVGTAFGATGDDDRLFDIYGDLRDIHASGAQLVLYFGDADYICNWLGGEVIADNLGIAGYDAAGFVNISSSDDVVHGQVKQVGNLAFARVYESGHEVPFYQPLVALEMYERVVAGLDVATGGVSVLGGGGNYSTVGPKKSTYREGNATVQYEVVPIGTVYNTTTNEPNPYNATEAEEGERRKVRRDVDVEALREAEKQRKKRDVGASWKPASRLRKRIYGGPEKRGRRRTAGRVGRR